MGKILKSTKKPVGSSEFDIYLKELWEACEHKLPLIAGRGVDEIQQTDLGQVLHVTPARGGAAGDEIEVRDCVTGRTFILRGRLKPV